jgi:chitodextrinase
VTFTDLSEPVAQMRLALSPEALETAAWQPYTPFTSVSLTATEGQQFVYAQVRDAAGNASMVVDGFVFFVDTQAPAAPTDLSASATAWNQVLLSWTASTGNVIRYEISRDGTPIAIVNWTATTFTDRSVSPATSYSYTVRAFDEAGNSSAPSAPASATTPAFAPPVDATAPSRPTNVNANVVNLSSTYPAVLVTWAPSTDNMEVTSYTVLRDGVPLATVDAIEDPELLAMGFTDHSGGHTKTYAYSVRAHDAAGNSSAVSASDSATTPSCSSCSQTLRPVGDVARSGFVPKSGTTLYTQLREGFADGDTTYINGPAAKPGFATVRVGFWPIGSSTTSVRVQWSAKRVIQSGTTGTAYVRVELYAGSTLIGTGAIRSLTSTYFTHTDTFTSIPNGTSSDLRVKIDQLSASTKTSSRVTWVAVVVTNNPPSDTTPPSVPTGLAGTAASDRQVNLSWQPSSDTNAIQGYVVYRNGARITSVPVGSTTYRDVGLSPATAYEYRVFAQDGRGNESGLSTPMSVTTASAPTPPADTIAPSVPTWGSTTCISPTRIDLAWNASTDNVGVQGYEVFRDGVQVGDVPVGSTSFSDTGLVLGVEYAYTLRAIDGRGNLSPSSAARFGTTCPNA